MRLRLLRPTPGHALWLSRALAFSVFLFAALVLAFWVLGSPLHRSVVMPSRVAMNANTAMGLAVASLALWFLTGPAAPRWRQRVALGCALAVAALGAVTYAEYLLGTGLGIDRLFGHAASIEINTTNPGRTSPETALNLALLGTALCWVPGRRTVLAAQALAVLVAMVCVFNLIGYAYGTAGFYKFDHLSSIGVATASAFVALGSGVLCARPEAGLMRSIINELPGGVVIRRLLLAVLALPLALGWLEMRSERAGLIDHAFGTVLAEVAGSLALTILIWRTANVLERNARDRQRAEDARREASEHLEQELRGRMEARLRLQSSALESAANAITITDRSGKIEWVNPAFCTLCGFNSAEAVGQVPWEMMRSGRHSEEFFRDLWTTIQAGKVWNGEVINRRKNGSFFTVLQTITPVRDEGGEINHFISIKEDITEKKQLEEHALRAQRIQNIGMLAAGIAHDFNNALAPIHMAGPLLRDKVCDADGQRILDIIEQSSERGAALVRQMLSFARGTTDKKVNVQVRHVLKEVLDLVRTTFPKSFHIESRLPKDMWPVLGDPTQLHQIFLNLCINARDAMPNGGELMITAANRRLGAGAATDIADGYPGDFLAVEVRDTGTGIPPDVLTRIWEPFFTTKGVGKGTGLGLSTVRGIMHQHEGFAAVQTTSGGQAGHGTAITVYFPAIKGGNNNGEEAKAPGEPALRGDGELILVVDDEESVREISAKILDFQGYRVLTASNGAHAIAAYGPRAAEVRLLLTDYDMPIMDGSALINVLRRLNPYLPVVIMSGEDGQRVETRGMLGTAYLAKPFTAETLMLAVRRALDEARPVVPCLAEA